MRTNPLFLLLTIAGIAASSGTAAAEPIVLFDGRTFRGWDGDTNRTWRIEDGALVGGSLSERVPRNEFLATIQSFTNFVLRAQFKLEGTEGFINAGVQIRSQRLSNPPNEMIGYQCDLGEGYWGCLYDESRRNKILAKPEAAAVEKALKKNDWNQYEIRCEGQRIRTWINGVPMIDYTEPDASIPQFGRIGLQIHGDGKALVAYRKIELEPLREFSKPVIDFGIVVRDAEKSARFYTEAIGCTEVPGFSVTGELGRKIGLIDNVPVNVRVFVLGEGDLATRIKILSFPEAPGRAPDQSYIHSTYGIRYLTLYVSSADRALERLAKAGVKTIGETPVSLGGNTRLIALRDPDGIFIELIGP